MGSDLISRAEALRAVEWSATRERALDYLKDLPSAQPEIVQCKDCKHNPKDTWFECPMSHLSENQRPETAWCWKGERRTDE